MKKLFQFHPENWTIKFYLGTAVVLIALNVLGPNGFIHWVLVNQEVSRLTQKKSKLESEIAQTKSDLVHFKTSIVSKERAIRQELGYLKPDEVSIEILPSETVQKTF